MSDYIIATSSTSDLTRDYLDAHSIPFISYSYTIGDKLYEDDCREESRDAVYKGMRNNGDLLKTSMINEYIYCDFFNSLLDSGKDIIFLDMSKKMSVSYEKALIGADMARKEHPDRKLYVMDTLCISGGLGLLVENMVKRMEAGMSYDEVIKWGEASALVGSLLSVKPVLYVPDGGTLDVAKKVRGRKAALAEILRGVTDDLKQIDTKGLEMHILHADCLKDAEHVRDEVRAAFPDVGEITISNLGVVIGAHCGPGLLTVFYFCNGRKP